MDKFTSSVLYPGDENIPMGFLTCMFPTCFFLHSYLLQLLLHAGLRSMLSINIVVQKVTVLPGIKIVEMFENSVYKSYI